MTLDTWIPTVEGKTLDFDGLAQDAGQCVQLVSFYLKDVLGAPVFYTNAIDWWLKFDGSPLVPNFDKANGPPKKGDLVIFGAGVGSVFGHIDICIQDGNPGGFLGFDSNWGGNKTAHKVQHNLQYILGNLRPKGGDMPTEAEVRSVFKAYNAVGLSPDGGPGVPSSKQVQDYTSSPWIRLVQDMLNYVEGRDTVNAGDMHNIYLPAIGREPNDNDKAKWIGQPWKNFTEDLVQRPDFAQQYKTLNKQSVEDYIGKNLQ